MSSISIQSGIRGSLTCPSFTSHKSRMKPLRASSIPVKHKAFSLLSPTIVDLRSKPIRRMQLLSASAIAFTDEDEEDEDEDEDGADDDDDDDFDFFPTQKTKVQKDEEEDDDDDDDDDDDFFPTQKTKEPEPEELELEPEPEPEVVVRKKPRLVLKFIWMEKNIGLGLDQMISGHGTVPLSPYYFWPRKDAWEELKTTLESKQWISQKKMIILLNQATDIINLWQQSGGNLS
ncbi:uncharacterized protein LOC131301427 [Rhododendron vialii]|uniref:uncharacterized protein LOC131301427 n=1 Tax=Rhododendron vialii TaxID=182163 RepID=UPI00265E46BB|nr:uncharacterized protein LOC131301427 [Rhododendron vialii]